MAREGEVTGGDCITVVSRDGDGVTVSDLVGLYTAEAPSRELLRRASDLPALPESWREHFRKRLTQ